MIEQTCKFGCGEVVSPGKNWKRGHISRVKNNWGHNLNAQKNSTKTRKERHTPPWNKGKKGLQVAWNKGLSKEDNHIMTMMAQSLSETKKKDEKNKERIAEISRKYWSKQENRDLQRERRIEWLQNNFVNSPSLLEIKFMNMLDEMDIKYKFQYGLGGYLYDFKIKGKKLVIEVDGDFHHFNPEIHSELKYDIQKHTAEHDKIKNEKVKEYKFDLIRFWENDINNNPKKVKNKLLTYL